MSAALFLIKRHEVTAKQGEGKMIGRFFAKQKNGKVKPRFNMPFLQANDGEWESVESKA